MNKYFSIFKTSFKQNIGNKPMIFGLCFLLILLVLTYNQLWVVIGKQEGSALNISFIWYLLLGEIIILSPPRVDRVLDEDIKTGTMAYYINKPVSFFAMRFTEAVAAMSVVFIFLFIIGGSLTFILTDNLPFKLWQLPIITIMCFGSCIINTFFKCIIGLCAIWFNSTRSINMVLERFAFIFGGAIFPLTIYPEWFVDIAKYTPFYSYYYLTIRLVYDFSWQNLAIAATMNSIWILFLASFAGFAYNKLSKRVDIYGG